MLILIILKYLPVRNQNIFFSTVLSLRTVCLMLSYFHYLISFLFLIFILCGLDCMAELQYVVKISRTTVREERTAGMIDIMYTELDGITLSKT